MQAEGCRSILVAYTKTCQ